MKLVKWECPNAFVVPMVEDNDLNLWGVPKGAAGAFGVSEIAVRQAISTNKKRFGANVTSSDVNQAPPSVREFMRQNRDIFGVQRVRRILSENDVLKLAMIFQTPEAIAAQDQFLVFIKQNMKKNFVTVGEYKELLDRYEEVIGRLDAIESGVPYVRRAASAAGAALAAHKGTTKLRLVK